jgi:hypothetical protein
LTKKRQFCSLMQNKKLFTSDFHRQTSGILLKVAVG